MYQFLLFKKSSLTKPFITGVSLRTKCGLAQGPLAYFLGPSLSCLPTKYITPPSPWPPHWAFEWSRALAVMWRAHWSIPKGQNKITAWPDGTAHSLPGQQQALVHTKPNCVGGAYRRNQQLKPGFSKADGLQVVSRHSHVSPGCSGDALSSPPPLPRNPWPGLLLIPFLVSFYRTTFQTSRVLFVNSLPF